MHRISEPKTQRAAKPSSREGASVEVLVWGTQDLGKQKYAEGTGERAAGGHQVPHVVALRRQEALGDLWCECIALGGATM